MKKHPVCFDGTGERQGQYHITVDPSIPVVVHAPRRVSPSLRNDINNELDHIVPRGMITKIQEGEPTAWVSRLV